MEQAKIVYHQVVRDSPGKPGIDCADGIVAAWIANKWCCKQGINAKVEGWSYGCDDLPGTKEFDGLIIVDFSFPSHVIDYWIGLGLELIVLDHHKTAKQELEKFLQPSFRDLYDDSWIDFNMDECGESMAWNFFFPDSAPPPFLKYIKDRDLWNFNHALTHEAHEVMGRLGRDFKTLTQYSELSQAEFDEIIKVTGSFLLKPKRKAITKAVEGVRFGEVAGYSNIPHVITTKSTDRLISDICSELYKKYPEALFVACQTSRGEWSLRSDKNGNNTDVGAIAKAMGGGGHHNASGFVGANK